MKNSLFVSVAAIPVLAYGGAVYTTTNLASGNGVLAYERGSDGVLGSVRSFATGGKGAGAELGSQGAIALTDNERWLIAVNAGSNDVTVFSVAEDGLVWRSRTPSGGVMPISVAVHGDLVAVLNGGGTPGISIFRLNENGSLTHVSGRNLTGSAPAEVGFNRDGSLLAVTEKASNTIELFLADDGSLSGPHVSLSHGQTPFGFTFTKKDRLLVTEAGGGPGGTSAVSSYAANDENGSLSLLTESFPDTQKATCWAVVTDNGKYVFVANTGSGTISSIAVDHSGALSLLNAAAGNTGANSQPGDMSLTKGSRFLYTLTPGNGSISGFRVNGDGSLTSVGFGPGVPSVATGVAAR